MRGWVIFLIVLLPLLLLAQIRVGAEVEYSEEGFFARLLAGPLRIQLFPGKKKEEQEKNQKKKQPEKKQAGQKKAKPKGGLVELVLELLPVVLDTVKKFGCRLQVDRLEMELTIGTPDPADAALLYGQANALLGSLWNPITQVCHVKDGHAHVGIDFDADIVVLYLKAALTLTVGQVVTLGFAFAGKALAAFLRVRSRQKKKDQPSVGSEKREAA